MIELDIRQSEPWSRYIENYGWETILLSDGSRMAISKYLFFKRANLLRPKTLTKEVLTEIQSICRSQKILFVKISPSHNQSLEYLTEFGYLTTRKIDLPPKTMFINLKETEDVIWKSLKSNCRYSINKSTREGDRIEFIQNPNEKEIKKYYSLISKRGLRKGFLVQNYIDHKNKIKAFSQNAFIGNVYNKENELLGTKLFLGHGNDIWGMYAGTSNSGQKSCGGYKLLWESFLFFKANGYNVMDLDGLADDRFAKLSKKWKGYTFFKKQFNGTEVSFPLPHIKYFIFN